MKGFYEHDNEEIHKKWKFLDRWSSYKNVKRNIYIVKSATGNNRLAFYLSENSRLILRKVN
jgi:hypothetical protein